MQQSMTTIRRARRRALVAITATVTGIIACGAAVAATGSADCDKTRCEPAAVIRIDYGHTPIRIEDPAPRDENSVPPNTESSLSGEPNSSPLIVGLELSDTNTDSTDKPTDVVARLLERRALEEASAEAGADEKLTSALPGLGSDSLRRYRQQMYRTDI